MTTTPHPLPSRIRWIVLPFLAAVFALGSGMLAIVSGAAWDRTVAWMYLLSFLMHAACAVPAALSVAILPKLWMSLLIAPVVGYMTTCLVWTPGWQGGGHPIADSTF